MPLGCGREPPDDRAADHAAVAGDPDALAGEFGQQQMELARQPHHGPPVIAPTGVDFGRGPFVVIATGGARWP